MSKKWPTWAQLEPPDGAQIGPKIDSKSILKSIKNLMRLGIDFWKDLGGFREPKWGHVGTQKGFKMALMFKDPKIKKTYKNQ